MKIQLIQQKHAGEHSIQQIKGRKELPIQNFFFSILNSKILAWIGIFKDEYNIPSACSLLKRASRATKSFLRLAEASPWALQPANRLSNSLGTIAVQYTVDSALLPNILEHILAMSP